MSPSNNKPKRQPRKAYQAPKVETVPIATEEALLSICAFSDTTSGSVFQGAPCSACFSSS